tara:strand:+ start:641 stop:1102 length:462 start_codon:yes stop_codon:yes gene_type:complete
MRITIIIILIFTFIASSSNAEMLKPNPTLLAKEVISIQLSALQKNDIPYKNAGIEQTWEFAHPNNRIFTGPLSNFINMMYSESYLVMLNHKFHNIIFVEENNFKSFFFIEIIDKFNKKFGFQWIVEKVTSNNQFKNCWMTVGVSRPIFLSERT